MTIALLFLALILATLLGWLLKQSFNTEPWVAETVSETANEGPLGLPFPKYAERAARMSEALDIMRQLLDGEKLDYDGEYYKTDRAKLYSPPVGPVPIWLAAGGPKSAALAARKAEGIITSVKVPADTIERVIDPATAAAQESGRPNPKVMASRWSVLAGDDDEAWAALRSWRGLRAPAPGRARGTPGRGDERRLRGADVHLHPRHRDRARGHPWRAPPGPGPQHAAAAGRRRP